MRLTESARRWVGLEIRPGDYLVAHKSAWKKQQKTVIHICLTGMNGARMGWVVYDARTPHFARLEGHARIDSPHRVMYLRLIPALGA
jgi:hypothetical protein